jgi:hypothetical protein
MKSGAWAIVVGTATRYDLDGPRMKPWWGRDFSYPSRWATRPTQPPVQYIPGLYQWESGQGVVIKTLTS